MHTLRVRYVPLLSLLDVEELVRTADRTHDVVIRASPCCENFFLLPDDKFHQNNHVNLGLLLAFCSPAWYCTIAFRPQQKETWPSPFAVYYYSSFEDERRRQRLWRSSLRHDSNKKPAGTRNSTFARKGFLLLLGLYFLSLLQTFKAWVNAHLKKRNLRVADMQEDFRDGYGVESQLFAWLFKADVDCIDRNPFRWKCDTALPQKSSLRHSKNWKLLHRYRLYQKVHACERLCQRHLSFVLEAISNDTEIRSCYRKSESFNGLDLASYPSLPSSWLG